MQSVTASQPRRAWLGRAAPYEEVHWFWSDQYDINIQYAGFHGQGDVVVSRGNPDERSFIAFHLDGDVLKSAVAINRKRDLQLAIPLIASRKRLDIARLGDEAVDMRSLAYETSST